MASTTSSRKSGRVKFFNSVKGFGFIIPDDQAGQQNIEGLPHRPDKLWCHEHKLNRASFFTINTKKCLSITLQFTTMEDSKAWLRLERF